MTNLFLFLIFLCLAGITYFLYFCFFLPAMKKNILFSKLSKKEKEAIEIKLGIKNYLGIDRTEEIEMSPIKAFTKRKISDKIE